jgi:hypothetical protein
MMHGQKTIKVGILLKLLQVKQLMQTKVNE